MIATALGDLAWPDVADGTTLVVPVGSVEQHGPHLPVDTDTRVAVSVATAVVERLDHVLLAPPVAYGASGEHEGFPGTVSIGHAALEAVLVEIGRSACRWAARLLYVNGHGGNAEALARAVRLLRYEGRDVAYWCCEVPGGDAHAGRTETSLVLASHPWSVRVKRFAPGVTEPLAKILPLLRANSVRSVSPNGVLGDPRGASPDEGRDLLAKLTDRLSCAVNHWQVDEGGRLRP
ncbi:creatininase [Carbonactinospora thermoautotrophica]|uniref:Creatininase n=1 Tax=Carbonactinospora thermoautotrophica TaxID=1469144 RepID=A0A132N5T3_9ACTN|nr:mycofactocin biosynthesis peptidyl-dipeptidase MftE [Carbonactinospora thermoautotrophica]KWX05505.1 creatininase [Carbonactinospora thermoautotrophica]KWX10720.1 creatininase [Carbonactinospora thermoautotrophica]